MRSEYPLLSGLSAAEDKLKVLAEYEAAEPGANGALLRREDLYSSHLVARRRARDAGALTGSSGAAARPGRRTPEQALCVRMV